MFLDAIIADVIKKPLYEEWFFPAIIGIITVGLCKILLKDLNIKGKALKFFEKLIELFCS